MTGKIKFTISPAVAAYVRPGTPAETRLAGCSAAAGLMLFERVTLLFCLSKDTDAAVRAAAVSQISSLPEDVVRAYQNSVQAHPYVLDTLARICHSGSTGRGVPDSASIPPADVLLTETPDVPDTQDEPEGEEPINEENEEFQSKYKIAQMMSIAEKIKMALSGDKEWRAILVKDSNKLVSSGVIRNPRITESEVLGLVKVGIQNDEIMRLICANKEWIKSYQMRKALIESSRTPVQNAMRYLGTMTEKDVAHFAKSKNISSVISTLAKRLLLNKKR